MLRLMVELSSSVIAPRVEQRIGVFPETRRSFFQRAEGDERAARVAEVGHEGPPFALNGPSVPVTRPLAALDGVAVVLVSLVTGIVYLRWLVHGIEDTGRGHVFGKGGCHIFWKGRGA